MTTKDLLVKAIVHVRQSWVQTTGASSIFASANVALGHADVLGIPATEWDISDNWFAMVKFFPKGLEDQPVKSLKAYIPKQEIVLIVELERSADWPGMRFNKD